MSPARSVPNDALPPRVSDCRSSQSGMSEEASWEATRRPVRTFAVLAGAAVHGGAARRARRDALGPGSRTAVRAAGQAIGCPSRPGRVAPPRSASPLSDGIPLLASARPTSQGMQVRVAEQDERAREPAAPACAHRGPWRGSGWRSRYPPPCWTLLPDAGSVDVLLLLAVLLGLVAAESFTVDFEFRKQGFTWSPSELAFVMALVAVGGAWTAVARAAAIGVVVMTQGYSRPKAAFNVSVAVLEVCAAVAVLRRPAGRRISAPATGSCYLVAVVAASLARRRPDRRRDLGDGGLSRPRAVDDVAGPRRSWSGRCPSSSAWPSCCWSASPRGRGC